MEQGEIHSIRTQFKTKGSSELVLRHALDQHRGKQDALGTDSDVAKLHEDRDVDKRKPNGEWARISSTI